MSEFAYVTQSDFQKINPFQKAGKNKLPDLFKRIRAKLNIPLMLTKCGENKKMTVVKTQISCNQLQFGIKLS